MAQAASRAERVATLVVRVVTGVVRQFPARWKRVLDDRLFGAIFQVTRVTNDAYGWRPPSPPPGGAPDTRPGSPPAP